MLEEFKMPRYKAIIKWASICQKINDGKLMVRHKSRYELGGKEGWRERRKEFFWSVVRKDLTKRYKNQNILTLCLALRWDRTGKHLLVVEVILA